jgi:hypothetical protein
VSFATHARSKDRVELKQGGFSTDEINSHCISYKISDEIVKTAAQVVQSKLTKQYQSGNQSAAPASQNSYQQHYNSANAAACVTPYGQLMQPWTNGSSMCVLHDVRADTGPDEMIVSEAIWSPTGNIGKDAMKMLGGESK